jgi:hypothetical protein
VLRLAAFLGVAALVAVSGAAAKSPRRVTVCGASGCVRVIDPQRTYDLTTFSGPFMLGDAPRPAPYFVLAVADGSPGSPARWIYVPSRRMLRLAGGFSVSAYWRSVPRSFVAALAPVVRGLRPYPAALARWRG